MNEIDEIEIQRQIVAKIEKISDILKYGHDIEIRLDKSGVKILEIKKGVVK